MSQDDRADNEHPARTNAAALARHFDIEVRDIHHDPVLSRRNSNRTKHDSRRKRGLLLQELNNPAQYKIWNRDQQEKKAKWKQKRPKGLASKTDDHTADPPGNQREHTERKPDIGGCGIRSPPFIASHQ